MLFDCCLLMPMLIVLASLRLIQRHRPIYAENSANTSTGTVQFQYWASTGAHTGIGTAAMEFISSTGTCQVPIPVLAWLLAAQTSELCCTLEKLWIRKRTLVSSSMGTSTGIALPRTGIGNLCVWVPTYISCMLERRGEEKEKEDGWGGRMEITPYYTDNTDMPL
jgi:hypothetical protein